MRVDSKPSSVMGNYLSRRGIAPTLQPSFKVMCRANNPLVDVAADRVYMAGNVSTSSVSSCLAFPPLPHKQTYEAVYFCCTFPEVTLGGR